MHENMCQQYKPPIGTKSKRVDKQEKERVVQNADHEQSTSKRRKDGQAWPWRRKQREGW